jgi:cell division protein FtsI (penicillin-binding protein 3)
LDSATGQGIEVPSETRGLLRCAEAVGRDEHSVAGDRAGGGGDADPTGDDGLTIANGGVYMPPHVLLQSTDEMKGDPRLQPAAFRPANQLPEPCRMARTA